MPASFFRKEILAPFVAAISLLAAQVSLGQDQSPTLLRLQRSKLNAEIGAWTAMSAGISITLIRGQTVGW